MGLSADGQQKAPGEPQRSLSLLKATPLNRSQECAGGREACATFVYVVQISLLAHGRQQMEDAGVDADSVVTVVLPGVVLDHIEKLSDKKQDPVLRVILVKKNRRQT